jgi:hypothetical protein
LTVTALMFVKMVGSTIFVLRWTLSTTVLTRPILNINEVILAGFLFFTLIFAKHLLGIQRKLQHLLYRSFFSFVHRFTALPLMPTDAPPAASQIRILLMNQYA